MRILVFSDTHGNYADMLTAIEHEHPDVIFHLGDVVRDLENVTYVYPNLPIYEVLGNCDWMVHDLPEKRIINLDGIKFFLCHGHTYSVKSGYSSAVSAAIDAGADVLLCGHTHIKHYYDYGGLQLMNPGSLGYGSTYGVIVTNHGVALCSIRTIK